MQLKFNTTAPTEKKTDCIKKSLWILLEEVLLILGCTLDHLRKLVSLELVRISKATGVVKYWRADVELQVVRLN